MKLLKIIGSIAFTFVLFSCENEVEINAEFEEKTFALALISAQSDTQFVKITKTFLDNETSAIQLAQDPNNLYYDSLNVTISELNNSNNVVGQPFKLSKILRTKADGLFTTERNEVYWTDGVIKENTKYKLSIDKLNGQPLTTGEATVTRGINIVKPASVNTLSFVDIRAQVKEYGFEFKTTENVGDFSARIVYNYIEINNVDSTLKSIEIPLASFENPSLGVRTELFDLDGQKFFDAIEANIPVSNNPPKRLIIDKAVDIIVEAADGNYTLYRDVNGPIDGLAQTRPEYTNITNGIGLFASRSKKMNKVSLNDDTKNYIVGKYGDRTNLSQYRGFEF